MEYKKFKKEGYQIHTITTDRFKTIYFAIHLKRKIKKEEITIRNFLADLLLSSTKQFPTLRELEINVEELYSLSASPSSYISGNYDVISITGTFLNECYTEPGMNDASISFLLDFLFQPNVENEAFAPRPFELEYQVLKEEMESLKDNPNRYSKIRLHELLGADTPLSYHGGGYLEDLKNITPENLYTYYQSVLEEDIIDIFVVGNFEAEAMSELIASKVPIHNKRLPSESHFVELPPLRSLIEDRETLPVQQSKLALGLVAHDLTDFERKYVLNTYSFILGGSSDSKLFLNVREKNSLCYSISASPSMLYGTIEIQAGIGADSYDQTVRLIQKTIQEIQAGEIKEEEVEKAIATYLSGCEEVADSQSALVSNYLSHEYLDNDLLEEKQKKIKEVTKEDVVNLAKKMTLEVIFFLEGNRANEEN